MRCTRPNASISRLPTPLTTYETAEPQPSPVLRWAGSKKRSVDKLLDHVPPEFDRYLEVFAGSACLFFSLAPQRALISDSNKELMRFYRVLARNPEAVYRAFLSFDRTAAAYYEVRKRFGRTADDLAHASEFLFLNRNCFNGIYRTNGAGHFNVPFSASRVPEYPSFDQVLTSARLLRRTAKRDLDFESICRSEVERNDFVYLDPPYYVKARRVFREYSSAPFCDADFSRLEKTLKHIDKRRARFLMSYPDCEEARELAKNWNVSRIIVRRTVAGNAFSRTRARELLVFNYDL